MIYLRLLVTGDLASKLSIKDNEMKKIIGLAVGVLMLGCLLLAATSDTSSQDNSIESERDTITSEIELYKAERDTIISEIELYELTGSNLRFAMADQLDDIRAYIKLRGVSTLEDSMQTMDGIMLNLLAPKLLEARLDVRYAESRVEKSGNSSLESAKKKLSILQAEAALLEEALREHSANKMVLDSMMRMLMFIEKRVDENNRVMNKIRLEALAGRAVEKVTSE